MSAPTEPGTRQRPIDALRGWALVGIALVNVPWIGFRESLLSLLREPDALAPIDRVAAVAVEGLCEGRFYPIFSALFGFGTGLLLDRGLAIYARRIVALLIFGVLHATFGWWGDVLLNYALAGIVLALMARLGPRVLFALALLFFALAQGLSLLFDTWMFQADDAAALAEHAAYVEREMRVYHDGTFASISQHRWSEMLSYFATYNLSYRANVLAMATLGLAIERSGIHTRLHEHRARIGVLALAAIALGIGLGVAVMLVTPVLYLASGDVMAIGYALGFLWIALRDPDARWLAPFAAVGRTSLTCYLVQTLCFTLFFYGYGLAMYGALGPAQGVLVALAVYAFEATVAMLWLRRYQHGPFEWLWRALTYLRAPAMRRI
ncbi:DUF418 domain-containing protein [Sandaracinus amylolyticus]|uniref:DUF418 domain-containing protein n=1 Tax=Sandaracinus amylolyticus TaxID=927083 RepID=UPI001F1FF07D|nr:DUF418 domain-containing protein [Sandaracinus amylolyticus]UJR82556.1 Hypothetical protein I5071_46210 [Sandaracinus amylolyticus]